MNISNRQKELNYLHHYSFAKINCLFLFLPSKPAYSTGENRSDINSGASKNMWGDKISLDKKKKTKKETNPKPITLWQKSNPQREVMKQWKTLWGVKLVMYITTTGYFRLCCLGESWFWNILEMKSDLAVWHFDFYSSVWMLSIAWPCKEKESSHQRQIKWRIILTKSI